MDDMSDTTEFWVLRKPLQLIYNVFATQIHPAHHSRE